jgi:hypothetical protein
VAIPLWLRLCRSGQSVVIPSPPIGWASETRGQAVFAGFSG